MLNVPKLGRFKIIPLLLTKEQRKEYVRYKEDNKSNLI
jgi:hypothetical protein